MVSEHGRLPVRARTSTRRHARSCCWCCFIFRRFFTQPVVAWAMLNLSLLLDGHVDDRSELRGDRDEARQRADRGAGLFARVLHLAGDL